MRILLINPPQPASMPNKEFLLPPSLLCLAAYVRERGHQPRILDLNTLRPWLDGALEGERRILEAVDQELERFGPELAGIGCLFGGQFPAVRKIARRIKQLRPNVPVAIGGLHPTMFAAEILEHCAEIDLVVLGEGEEALALLADHLERGADGRERIDGLAWRQGGAVRLQPKTRFIPDPDALPLPAYDLVDLTRYRHDTSHWHNPRGLPIGLSVPLLSSRSCPRRCSFCSMFLAMGPAWRPRRPERVADEMELLYRDFGVRHFSFMDDNLSLRRAHVLGLCREIERRGLRLQFETPNGLAPATLDEEVVDALAGAGWVRGAIAIETGSEELRNRVMGKGLTDAALFRALRAIRRHPQIHLKAYFILGMPEETQATLAATERMLERLDVDEVLLSNLLPFPGTALFAQALRDGLLIGIDPRELWRCEELFYTDNTRFFVKPYALEVEQLIRFRERVAGLIGRRGRAVHA